MNAFVEFAFTRAIGKLGVEPTIGLPLVNVAGGRDTAEAIPNAELLIIDGMGHDMPRPIWPRLIDAISNHAHRADG